MQRESKFKVALGKLPSHFVTNLLRKAIQISTKKQLDEFTILDAISEFFQPKWGGCNCIDGPNAGS